MDVKKLGTQLEEAFKKAQPDLQRELVNLAKETQREWAATVSGGAPLPGMTQRVRNQVYADAISSPSALVVSPDGMEVRIEPRDQEQVKLIEQGHPQWDMKPALLARKSAKTVGASKFVNVPITENKRGTKGRQIGQASRYRRVSTNTPSGKWIQKAVAPNPVVASVQSRADGKLGEVVFRTISKHL